MAKFFNGQPEKSLHVAIIMDGNGRWATRRGKPRWMGHQAGAEKVREIVEEISSYPVSTLTIYAFSSDNWKRPTTEVQFLMNLFRARLQSEVEDCLKNNIRLSFIGRRDRMSPKLVSLMEGAESVTRNGSNLHLRVAMDYSSRNAILEAARHFGNNGDFSEETFSEFIAGYNHSDEQSPEVDLLIRTGGEKRLSDFLLWECAYAELYFSDTMWPDFDKNCLQAAMHDFYSRERRFGRILEDIAV
jgi:undecaprenyl diphosphate synthase